MSGSETYLTSLVAGAAAGVVVDVSLFPIDTIKTRLQSSQGFFRSGGFRNVYKGLGPQAAGSAPTAALFFITYDGIKKNLLPRVAPQHYPFVYMLGASISEVVACLIRVPIEVVKQRKQTSIGNPRAIDLLRYSYENEGLFKGVYRGFGSTVYREIPFSLIQFPIWEYFKRRVMMSRNSKSISPGESAICGAVAGGIAAFITTPLDVAKTRIMLANRSLVSDENLKLRLMIRTVYNEKGVKGLWSGAVPRTIWITLGGFVFFGTYEITKTILESRQKAEL